MTVSTETILSGPFIPNGVTTTFPFTMRVLDGDELRVFRLSAAGDQSAISDGLYTVTLTDNGGSVIFTTAPLAGDPLYIESAPSFEQAISFENEGAFLPEVLTEALDRAAVRDLWLRGLIERSPRVPLGEEAFEYPSAAARASRIAFYDAFGDPVPGPSADILSSLIAATIVPALPIMSYVGAIAGLVALSPLLLADGSVVQVSGYYVAGDGGGGRFQWVAGDVSAADGGAVLQANAGGAGRWKRLFDGDELNIRWWGARSNAVVNSAGTVSASTSCATAYFAARAYGIGLARPFTVLIEGGSFLTTASLTMVSRQTLRLRDATIYGDLPAPTPPFGHQQLTVIGAFGVELNADTATYPGTGDYVISAPREFVADTALLPGADAIPALNAGAVTGVSAGTWLQVWMGVNSWHGFVSEFAEASGVVGTSINLKRPLQYEYSNKAAGIGAFTGKYKRAKNPPGNVPLASWGVAGFRRFAPCLSPRIIGEGDARIINLRDHSGAGYADFAIFAWAAIGLEIRGIKMAGGSFWTLDCQDVTIADCETEERYASSSAADASWLINGSNRVDIVNPVLTNASLVIEEAPHDVMVKNPHITNGLLQCFAAAIDVTVIGGSVGLGAGRAVQVGGGGYEFGVAGMRLVDVAARSDGAALALDQNTLLAAHPSIDPAMIPAVERYFRGEQLFIERGKYVSPLNPSVDISTSQRVRAADVEVGFNAAGGIAGTAPSVIGTARRAATGDAVGYRTSAALPTVPAAGLGDVVYKTDGTKVYVCTNYRRMQVLTQIDGDDITVSNAGSDGGLVVGDVLEILISNGGSVFNTDAATTSGSATVTVASTAGYAAGMAVTGENIPTGTTVLSVTNGTQFVMSNPAAYTLAMSAGAMIVVGNIRKEHVTKISALPGGAQVTVADAFPAGYAPVIGSTGYIKASRWA